MAKYVITGNTILSALDLGGNDELEIGTGVGTVWGDYEYAPAGQARGGNDTITGGADLPALILSGDVLNAVSGSAADRFSGGKDVIAIGTGIVQIAGDAFTAGGTVAGGDDTITRTGGNGSAAESSVTGDLGYFLSGTAHLGSDTIAGADGGAAGEVLVGDVYQAFAGTIWAGSDVIGGRGGDDRLFGDVYLAGNAEGRPVIHAGDDLLDGGAGNDLLVGDVGYPDPAVLYAGDDTLVGGEGNDSLLGDQQVLHGAFAADARIRGGNDRLLAGDGDDLTVGGGGDDWIDGGDGSDSIGFNQLTYDSDGNPLSGGIVVRLAEGRGEGSVSGAHGNDTLISIENVLGSLGDDRITANSLGNLLNGSLGSDTIDGAGGNDTIIGEEGDDLLLGRLGNDYLLGGAGGDTLWGGIGNDTLVAMGDPTGGSDLLYGGDGADAIYTGPGGGRTVYGGGGDDAILSSGGISEVWTGLGRDVVWLRSSSAMGADSTAHVRDFVDGLDRINLRSIGATDANVDRLVHLTQTADGARLSFTGGGHTQTIVLHGVSASSLDLHGGDFILG